ncbi:2TM domain-containing protein [Terrimonas alba]|uniref:2TM domain-containing protein n=1 Tax=Terrimonas alba TaxID=3349636 RepID=UPI0035F36504
MDENSTGKRDQQLWSIAKKRAGFKSHFYTYITVNAFLWLIWLITTPAEDRTGQTPWPVWPLMGWGIGLAMHFVFTYIIKYDEKEAIQKEYEKLIKEKH